MTPRRAKVALAEVLEVWPTADLKPNPRQVRRHPPEQIEILRRSIERLGFNDPVGIHKDGTVIEGWGRVLAARALNMKELPVIVLDHLNPDELRAYAVAHNRLAELSSFDPDLLAGEIAAISDLAIETPVLGFSEAEVATLLDDLVERIEVTEPRAPQTGKAADPPDRMTCPTCGARLTGVKARRVQP